MLSHLATRDYRFQKYDVLVLNEWDHTDVAIDVDNEDPLIEVALVIRVHNRVQQAPVRYVINDVFKRNAPLALEPLVLIGIPIKKLHNTNIAPCVHIGNRLPSQIFRRSFPYFRQNVTNGAARRIRPRWDLRRDKSDGPTDWI